MAEVGHRNAEGTGLSVPEAGSAAALALGTGQAFVLLLEEDHLGREAALKFVLDATADGRTRLARVSNPLRARLTLERLLIQVIAGGVGSTSSDPASLMRQMAERQGDEGRVVLVIEQAETLEPEVLRFLGQAEPMFKDAELLFQVLFVGRPQFHAVLSDPEAGMDRHAALLEACRTQAPETVPAATRSEVPKTVVPVPPKTRPARGLARQLAMVAVTLSAIAAVLLLGFLALTAAKPTSTNPAVSATTSADNPTSPGPAHGPAPNQASAVVHE